MYYLSFSKNHRRSKRWEIGLNMPLFEVFLNQWLDFSNNDKITRKVEFEITSKLVKITCKLVEIMRKLVFRITRKVRRYLEKYKKSITIWQSNLSKNKVKMHWKYALGLSSKSSSSRWDIIMFAVPRSLFRGQSFHWWGWRQPKHNPSLLAFSFCSRIREDFDQARAAISVTLRFTPTVVLGFSVTPLNFPCLVSPLDCGTFDFEVHFFWNPTFFWYPCWVPVWKTHLAFPLGHPHNSGLRQLPHQKKWHIWPVLLFLSFHPNRK